MRTASSKEGPHRRVPLYVPEREKRRFLTDPDHPPHSRFEAASGFHFLEGVIAGGAEFAAGTAEGDEVLAFTGGEHVVVADLWRLRDVFEPSPLVIGEVNGETTRQAAGLVHPADDRVVRLRPEYRPGGVAVVRRAEDEVGRSGVRIEPPLERFRLVVDGAVALVLRVTHLITGHVLATVRLAVLRDDAGPVGVLGFDGFTRFGVVPVSGSSVDE